MRLVSWWVLKKARFTAWRYKLDFEVKCVFDEQLKPYGYPRHGSLCKIAMKSGREANYRAFITKWWPGGTGQKSWVFVFEGYVS